MCHKLHYSVLLFAFCAAWSSTIQAQLVGLWTFEEGAGDRVVDRSGNGHDGTIVDAQYQAGGFDGSGFAMAFSGQVTSRVSVGSFDIEGPGITLAGWLKASNLDTPGQDPRMISKATAGAADAHIFLLSSARSSGIKVVRFRLRTDNGQATTTLLANTTTGTLLVDEWIHAAATWDGATMRVFKNGREVGSTARDGGAVFADGSVGVALGNQPNGAEDRPFEGLLDDLVILSEALTEEGILEIMEGFASPALAANPSPAHNGNDVPRDTVLTWTSGEFANTHTAYLGASFDDVNDASAANPGDVLLGEGLTDASVDSGRLQFDQTYYWQVVEVNDAATPARHAGDIWRFTTPEYLLVDDFESYADDEFLEIWATWVDGFEDDTNGSLVGNGITGSPETTIVNGDKQSLPLHFDNSTIGMSEATRTFDAASGLEHVRHSNLGAVVPRRFGEQRTVVCQDQRRQGPL